MKKNLLLFTLLIITSNLLAQDFSYDKDEVKVGIHSISNMSDDKDDWMITLQNLEMPKPGSKKSKEELYRLKEEMRKLYPIKTNSSTQKTVSNNITSLPIVGASFEGNIAGSSVPNDNDMAISDGGYIVSAINSVVYIYDAANPEEYLARRTLNSFSDGLSFSLSKFDPKVIYDPIADRFILVFLAGSTHQSSRIVICYSQTNDPTGDWNIYKITGNPLDNETWSDYPVVAINDEELFIGFNTFTNGSSNNSGFVEGTFWQIRNAEGYNGDTLITQYYHHILCDCEGKEQAIFNVTPVKGGSWPYGPNMYLLSNKTLKMSNDTVYLMEVTGRVDDPNTELVVRILNSENQYFLPPVARQAGPHEFDTNDSRVLGAFFEKNKIQFVQACMDTSTGLAGVYHGFIDYPSSANPKVYGNILGDEDLDYGYPNISYSGKVNGDIESIINVNHTSDTVFSGFSAIYYSNEGTYSNVIRIKAGDNYVDRLTSDLERWGDYSGSQRKYNEPGKVWAVGSFGKTGFKHGTWIAELSSPDSVRYPSSSDVNLFPNPSSDLVNVSFTLDADAEIEIDIYDAQGRFVKKLVAQKVFEGKNLLQFSSTHLLTAGIYFVKGFADGEELFETKFVKNSND